MRQTRIRQILFTYLPLIAILCSISMTTYQAVRRERLKREYAVAVREYDRLHQRYTELHQLELKDAQARK
jgi:hypothetical protein